jgi:hypothetical protein
LLVSAQKSAEERENTHRSTRLQAVFIFLFLLRLVPTFIKALCGFVSQ